MKQINKKFMLSGLIASIIFLTFMVTFGFKQKVQEAIIITEIRENSLNFIAETKDGESFSVKTNKVTTEKYGLKKGDKILLKISSDILNKINIYEVVRKVE